jgi:preprotein translocase subunit SecF
MNLKTKNMKLLSLILLTILIASCNPCRYVARHQECFPPDSITSTSTESVKDSSQKEPPDSSIFEALFECDSLNNALMKEVNEVKSQGVQTQIVYRDNKIYIRTSTPGKETKIRTVIKTVTVKEKIMNPVDAELKRKNLKLEKQVQRKTVLVRLFGISLTVLIILIALYIWFKFIK